MVLVDSSSGWLECIPCQNRHTETVIKQLRDIFARFGVPRTLVTDNAPEFTNPEFRAWLQNIGCKLVHSPEYHPRSNGVAERMVRHLKDGLKAFSPQKCSSDTFIARLLFVHRNTANRDGKTPAEMLFGRTLRCPILSHFSPQQRLNYTPTPRKGPSPVTFILRHGHNTSLVQNDSGRTIVAHDSQLAPQPVTEALPLADTSDHGPDSGESSRYPIRQRHPTRFFPAVDPKVEGRSVAHSALG